MIYFFFFSPLWQLVSEENSKCVIKLEKNFKEEECQFWDELEVYPAVSPPLSPLKEHQVRTRLGVVEGFVYDPNTKVPPPKLNTKHDSTVFLGIPYAQPPGFDKLTKKGQFDYLISE